MEAWTADGIVYLETPNRPHTAYIRYLKSWKYVRLPWIKTPCHMPGQTGSLSPSHWIDLFRMFMNQPLTTAHVMYDCTYVLRHNVCMHGDGCIEFVMNLICEGVGDGTCMDLWNRGQKRSMHRADVSCGCNAEGCEVFYRSEDVWWDKVGMDEIRKALVQPTRYIHPSMVILFPLQTCEYVHVQWSL